MGMTINGPGGATAQVGAFAAAGIHIISKPHDHGTLGSYTAVARTGVLAAALASASQLFQFRWTDSRRLAVITKIWSGFTTLTRFTAGTITDFGIDAFMIRGIGAGGGSTTLNLLSDEAQMRTSMGNSLAQLNVAATAAMTAATTLDIHPFAQVIGAQGDQVTGTVAIPSHQMLLAANGRFGLLFESNIKNGEHPIVLAVNDGFVIRNRATWPVAGTGQYVFVVSWSEVDGF